MTMSLSISPRPLIAGGLLLLSICSGGALAADATAPEPHWSGLPFFGTEAQARGYQLPLPFGVGITGFYARQPVDIHDLQLARGDNPPRSVTNFLKINRVDTTQQNASVKIDVLLFPFLDVYGLFGYTKGTTKGLIQVPDDPILGIFEPAVLQLNASFRGPTYGGGLTLQGGFKVSDAHDLTAIAVADFNRTKTNLEFDNETLIAKTKPVASVFSGRVGLHGTLSGSTAGAIWVGAMYQRIQQTVAGSVANTDLQFVVVQSPAKPWNTLVGGVLEVGRSWNLLLEGGFGARTSVLAGAVYRF